MKPLDVGVCSWSIDRHDVLKAIHIAGAELGLRVMQLGFFTQRAVFEANADAIKSAAREANVEIVGGFLAFEGEDYSSIERIASTGGFFPDDVLEDRLSLVHRMIPLMKSLSLPSMALHIGTVPTDNQSAGYRNLLSRSRDIANALAKESLQLLLETGREPAERLSRFINEIGQPNVAINFDPANFIVYGSDDPVRAVTQLKGHIQLVHLKDAKCSAKPGIEYGKPAPLGAGEAEIARVISKLRATCYRGPLLLECDTRVGGLDALCAATDYVRSMFA